MSLSGDQLWDPGQEWIQIFDNLLKHPQECKLFLMSQTKCLEQSWNCKLFDKDGEIICDGYCDRASRKVVTENSSMVPAPSRGIPVEEAQTVKLLCHLKLYKVPMVLKLGVF